MNQVAELSGVGWEVSERWAEKEVRGWTARQRQMLLAVLHRTFTLRPVWPRALWLPVRCLSCTWLHMFCGKNLTLQVNLKPFCGEHKVRLKDREQMLTSTELLSSSLGQGNLENISSCINITFLMQSELGQLLIFFRICIKSHSRI